MIEPSLRTLPPLTLSRDYYGANPTRLNQHYHQPHHIHSPPEERPMQDNMERSGDCTVILPFSRSAFRGSQHPNKCECSSFYMNPGDPSACLCGHPASCHNPKPSGSEASSSNESSPYMPSISMFTQAYAGPMLSPPASVSHPSPRSNSHSYHQEDALTPAILARLTQLEKILASEIHARQIVQENQKYIQLTQKRLSERCRYLSEEIDLIISKSGESARESLDLEVLNQRQKKMADDIEWIKGSIEGLDERTEDLEFRNDDLEKWVEEDKERRMGPGNMGSERDEHVASTVSTQKEDGASQNKRATLALTTTTTVSVTTDASTLPSLPLSSKRRRSSSDAAPPSYELSCIAPSISNIVTEVGSNSSSVTNKRLRHGLNRE